MTAEPTATRTVPHPPPIGLDAATTASGCVEGCPCVTPARVENYDGNYAPRLDMTAHPDTDREPFHYAVYWTADVMIPDDTDTDHYSEPCEPGYGYRVESGYVDPDWSITAVQDERPEPAAIPNVVDVRDFPDDYVDPLDALADYLESVQGPADAVEPGYGGVATVYGAEYGQPDYSTGVTVNLTAHVYGLTDGETDALAARLAPPRYRPWSDRHTPAVALAARDAATVAWNDRGVTA